MAERVVTWTGQRPGHQARAALAELERRGWLVMTPDMPWRSDDSDADDGAGVDHVVLGPTGGYLLEVKGWPGRVSVRNDLLRVEERSRDRLLRETVSRTGALAADVPVDLKAHVRPVLLLDRDESLELVSRDVLVCSWPSLVDALVRRPAVWGPQHIAFVAVMLRRRLGLPVTDDDVPLRPRWITAAFRPRS
jgi:hypothetical protein